MTEILMSAEVRALLGDEGAARVREIPLAGGHCPICHQPLPPAGPATVLLVRSPTVTNAGFAHPGCAPSSVIDISDEQMAEAMPDEADMTMTAALVEHGRGVLLPTLMAELDGVAYIAQGAAGSLGDLTDVVVSAMLARGFALVTRLREAPRHAAGWSATLTPVPDGATRLDVVEPGGGILYTGTVHLPDGWAAAADRYGWCVVYTGGFRLTHQPDTTLRALRAAASAGSLTGARMPVTWSTA